MSQPVKTQEPKLRSDLTPHKPEDDEKEEVTGSPNDKVRAKTGQPGVLAAVPLNQILTPNQVVKTNVSHKAL